LPEGSGLEKWSSHLVDYLTSLLVFATLANIKGALGRKVELKISRFSASEETDRLFELLGTKNLVSVLQPKTFLRRASFPKHSSHTRVWQMPH
jgi:hypothetical protein